jgi:hypothetical protein
VTELPAIVRFKKPLALAVHRILLLDWDPIGVKACGAADDDTEYDNYVGKIVERIETGQTPEKIAAYLSELSKGWMCPPEQREVDLEVARKLVALKTKRL